MFVIALPVTFNVGDTLDAKINGRDERVTWVDPDTLRIRPDRCIIGDLSGTIPDFEPKEPT
jgi:hypothetical protein